MRQHPGAADVLAKSVLSFDLCADGAVLFSNGSAVYRLEPDGKQDCLVTHAGLEQVIVLD